MNIMWWRWRERLSKSSFHLLDACHHLRPRRDPAMLRRERPTPVTPPSRAWRTAGWTVTAAGAAIFAVGIGFGIHSIVREK